MRRLLAAGTLLALLVAGLAVPATATTWVRTSVTFEAGGLERTYLVARPAHPGAGKLPVLVELHGCCTTPAAELQRSGFLTAASDAILVYPAGYLEHWNAGACCGTTRADDVSFVADVVRRVLAGDARADASRVYLVGYSNGGRMAYRVTCARPGLFAAVATFGAVSAQPCLARRPVPMLIGAGTKDPDVSVRHLMKGYLEPTYAQQAAQGAATNGCTGPAVTVTTGVTRTTTWSSCTSGHPVVLIRYLGAGHAWPPGLAARIWQFFRPATATMS